MKRICITLFVLISVFVLCCFALPQKSKAQDPSSVMKQFVGHWYPDRPGWHKTIDITTDGKKLFLVMSTEEGEKRFEKVAFNESEPSIKWSYTDDIKGIWYIGKWSETKRDEIILQLDRFNASCGVPTEIYKYADWSDHSKRLWKYEAKLLYGDLVIRYSYQWDFYSPSGELMFTKSNDHVMTIKYIK